MDHLVEKNALERKERKIKTKKTPKPKTNHHNKHG